MDVVTDAQFTRLHNELRPLRVSGYSSSEIDDEWDRLGWQRADSISALNPGTDFSGRILHEFVDNAQGRALRRWPVKPRPARVAATATVVVLHDLGIADRYAQD
ncbi:hypothetical protein [Nocardia salmonicida]|uniref:hypothetical protein n=1 Tax=Nocardia salmonicida TaxID=53431 RepID=UPI003798F5C7